MSGSSIRPLKQKWINTIYSEIMKVGIHYCFYITIALATYICRHGWFHEYICSMFSKQTCICSFAFITIWKYKGIIFNNLNDNNMIPDSRFLYLFIQPPVHIYHSCYRLEQWYSAIWGTGRFSTNTWFPTKFLYPPHWG